MHALLSLIIITLTFSCSERTALKFSVPKEIKPIQETQKPGTTPIPRDIEEEKRLAWAEIAESATEGFKTITPLIQRKCFDCHDANTKLPFYGRIFRSRNPINRHQVDGLKSLDFSLGFPKESKESSSQLSLLKGIKASVLDRTMPLRIYTRFYPRRKIYQNDQEDILAWVDPLITKIEDFEDKFSAKPNGALDETKKAFELKCFRCHANGNNRGGFGGMEDLEKLRLSKFVNIQNPEQSKLYKVMFKGSMPPDPRQAMTQEELQSIRDWIEGAK